MSDHGVDISGGNEEAEAGFTEPFELVGGAELGLAEHCAGKAVFFEDAGNESCAEGRMIDVSVSADIDKVGDFSVKLLGSSRKEVISENHGGGVSFRERNELWESSFCLNSLFFLTAVRGI